MDTIKTELTEATAKVNLKRLLGGWLRWLVINTIGAYIIYLAIIENINWAQNIVMFGAHIILFLHIMTAVYLHEHKEKKIELAKKKVVPVKIDHLYDIIISLFLASQGWFYYAIIWFIQILFVAYQYDADEPNASNQSA